ncbi:MAG: hypothetical protein DLM62_03690 [Pseudonocardiales bacterium]|nr:MAG: hypothetical protein DLM62_03690 [Pseudonocardiales bacterium]
MSSTPVLTASAVTKHYGQLTAVAEVDVSVAAGEILGISGASGSGKPLWRSITEPLMAGPRSGRPSRAARQARASEALARVGLAHLDAAGLPTELSVSQAQRVAILRAVLAAPTAVVADEPTSALDVTTAAGILALLRTVADAGTALVVVSHDQDMLAVLADRVVPMTSGRLASWATCQTGGNRHERTDVERRPGSRFWRASFPSSDTSPSSTSAAARVSSACCWRSSGTPSSVWIWPRECSKCTGSKPHREVSTSPWSGATPRTRHPGSAPSTWSCPGTCYGHCCAPSTAVRAWTALVAPGAG